MGHLDQLSRTRMAADQESGTCMLGIGSEPMKGRGKVQELERRHKASVRSGRFRGSLSVALIIICLKERETLIGMTYQPTLFSFFLSFILFIYIFILVVVI